ncbi:PTS system mannitol-specific IIA component/PTS system ascorbate-specific IIA component [Virgibacillus halotolerans]|uniref:PTS sugar transporter subunit IIA n=1 Tax=Virgibacillus halotolerans TaxID=1071053 RepID=UPI00195F43C7|nr:PTS sugar transporter subunit IIA [Virgibacillus halotolerans]MBM7600011.1 PTS system mannitol-specific IIA component/PTS system ascorbate-specific IIA component [Virgibacillus halotolerans]
MRFLEPDIVKIGVEAADAESAIEAAGNLLLQEGLVEESYIEAMKEAYRKNGPYFVLAPHIAIPHARPEDGVNEASVSLIQLKEPIVFGHIMNDPVQIVFGLGASSSDEHLILLKKLTGLLNDTTNVEKLSNATSYDEIKNILEMER